MKDRMKKTMSAEPRISSVLHLRAGMRGVPLAGNFELTARCNFNCRMCYVHQNQDPEKELTAQQWIELGRHARDRGMLFLLITGGEPMLRPDFPLIYKSLREMGLMVSINTNASLLTDEILELFRNFPPTRLNISLYGGNHETYRNLCGTAAYDIVTRNILRLTDLPRKTVYRFRALPICIRLCGSTAASMARPLPGLPGKRRRHICSNAGSSC